MIAIVDFNDYICGELKNKQQDEKNSVTVIGVNTKFLCVNMVALQIISQ